MNFFRNLVRDLVDKKLWPVAAALLLALVAVPVLLGGGSSTPVPRASEPVAAAGAPVATAAQVSLDTSEAADKRHRPGAVRNPFKQLHQPKPQTSATSAPGTGGSAATGAKGGAAGGSDKSGGTGGGSTKVDTTAPSVTKPVAQVAPSLAQRRVYRVAVRFGEAGALTTRRDAARLTALPSTAKTMALLLGVRSDRRTAVFMLAPGVQARGDGWCRPSAAKCHTLEMRAGDRQVLETASGTAGVVQYHLVVARVAKRTLKSRKAAARKHARVSEAGRDLLRWALSREIPGSRSYRYDARYGLLRAR